ncbi:hypothetical protein QFC22_006463 [Naganishia vaughanmartiniae]|uniref:Uncharacterized protein n=1 Tax=Naganishia vaughanmartiniae TaxID=1424756 RepID=A0ACC2WJ99_9TREE|nr:hypothetical protein QFC22_006463 [Naganishia vaughanmartiniae]
MSRRVSRKAKATTPDDDEDMEPPVDVHHMMQELQALKINVAESQDNMAALIDDKIEQVENMLIAQLNDELNDALTRPATVELLRESLHLEPYDENAIGANVARNRRRVGEPVSVELQQLVHHHYHRLLKKPRAKPFHWPELPKVSDEVGSVHHWPRPSGHTEAQPVTIAVSDVAADDKIVKDAFKKRIDIKWPTANASTATQARARAHRSHSSGSQRSPSTASDDQGQERQDSVGRTIEAWRPDWLNDGAISSTLFREQVIELCQATVALVPEIRQHSVAAITAEVDTYWANSKLAYQQQMLENKRVSLQKSRRRDRRRQRAERALSDRYDKISRSPLKYIADFSRLKMAITGADSWRPELLSDDEEGLFTKSSQLDERELYYRESTNAPTQYDKAKIWESREAFWMTDECRLAGILLDEFVRKQKPNVTPVFHVPYDATQKDIRLSTQWPTIREQDDQGRPKSGSPGSKSGPEGFVIYRFMVDHQKVERLPGYQSWQEKLYPDPASDDALPENPITGLPVPTITLQEACARPEFVKMGLWAEAKAQHRQFRIKRDPEEVLEERYRKLIAPPAQEEDEEQEHTEF